MWRVLAALGIIVFLFFFARWQKENPPPSVTTPNQHTAQVKEVIAGPALRARAVATRELHGVNTEQQRRLDVLNSID